MAAYERSYKELPALPEQPPMLMGEIVNRSEESKSQPNTMTQSLRKAGADRKDDSVENKQDDSVENKQKMQSRPYIAEKYKREGILILSFLLSMFIIASVLLIYSSVKQKNNPPVTLNRVPTVGNAHYPYFTICGLYVFELYESSFQNVSVKSLEWDTVRIGGDSKLVPWQYVNASRFGRKGVCIQVDTGGIMVSSLYHYINIDITFRPNYRQFCKNFNATDESCNLYGNDHTGTNYASETWILYVEKKVGQLSPIDTPEMDKPQTLVIPFNNVELPIRVREVQYQKLGEAVESTWSFAAIPSHVINWGKEHNDRQFSWDPEYRSVFWLNFDERLMTVIREVDPVNPYVIVSSMFSFAMMALAIWSRLCFKEPSTGSLVPTMFLRKIFDLERKIIRSCFSRFNDEKI
eukprot:jgi/Bigna1/68257/fgenesh1_pg.5_\